MKSTLLAFCLLSLVVRIVSGDAGTTSGEFLKLGIGPRAIAMGEAQVGLADDVYATYWNPAGLARLEVQEAGFVQNQYLQDISEQYAAYAYPTRKAGTWAVNFTYLRVGKFDAYDATGQPAGTVGASDAALGLSYARNYFQDRRMGSSLGLGFTAKYLNEQLASVNAHAYAGDLGLLFIPGKALNERLSGWKAGVVIKNLGSAMRFDEESFRLPQSLNAGVSYTGDWKGESFALTLDGRQPRDASRSFGAGLEVRTLKYLIARAGYTSEGDLGNGLRLGGGLLFRTLQVDYAYAGAGDLGAAHRIGITLRLGRDAEDPLFVAERWYQKGLKDYRGRRFTEALVEFNKALEIDPSHPEALKLMKKTYEEIKTMVPE